MDILEEKIQSSVFHFTKKKNVRDMESIDKLFNIVRDGFYPRYSKEVLNNIVKSFGKSIYFKGVPMVCFCGLGLVKIAQHLIKFGEYGIGLTKEWALKNRINPILYMVPDSFAVEKFNIIHDFFMEKFLKDKNEEDWYNFLEYISLINDIKYYEEREWRHIPDLKNKPDFRKVLDEIYYESSISDVVIENENNKLRTLPLKFIDDEVNFLIIPNSEIDKAKIKLKVISNQLSSKVISTEEIIEKYG